MNGNTADKIVDGLKVFAKDLEKGERILAAVTENCGCNLKAPVGQLAERAVTCHVCGGTDYIISSVTVLPHELIEKKCRGGVLGTSRSKLRNTKS